MAGSSTAGGASGMARRRPRLIYLANHITTERITVLATPPHTHVRKKLEPHAPHGANRQPSFDLNG